MNLSDVARGAGKFITDNSPAILTVIGVTGTVTTAVLTGKAAYQAARILSEEPPDLDFKEKLELTWTLYIPAATTGLLTVACIIWANRVGTRRAAALAAAYTLSEKTFSEYREKIVEKLGHKKEQATRDEIAQEQVTRNPPKGDIVVVNGGKVLCYEAFSGRYFLSDMEALRKAQNDINRQIINDDFASLADLYDLLGLQHTDLSEEMGWNSEQELVFNFSAVLSEDNRPCISFSYSVYPIRNYSRFH